MTAHIRKEEDIVFPRHRGRGWPEEEDMRVYKHFEDFIMNNFKEDIYPILRSVRSQVPGRGTGQRILREERNRLCSYRPWKNA